jgi:hypothetical protein
MLFRISPGDSDIRTAAASSKDHFLQDTGFTSAGTMALFLQ